MQHERQCLEVSALKAVRACFCLGGGVEDGGPGEFGQTEVLPHEVSAVDESAA